MIPSIRSSAAPGPDGQVVSVTLALTPPLPISGLMLTRALKNMAVVVRNEYALETTTAHHLAIIETLFDASRIPSQALLFATSRTLDDSAEKRNSLIRAIENGSAVAVAIQTDQEHQNLGSQLLSAVSEAGIPLLTLRERPPLAVVVNLLATELLDRRAAELARVEQIHRSFADIMLQGGGVPEVACRLAELIAEAVLVTTIDGRILAEAGSDEALAHIRSSSCTEDTGRFRTELEPSGLHTHPGLQGNHIAVSVLAGGVDHARIIAHSPSGALKPEDQQILDQAATVTALAITKRLAVEAVESKYHGDFFRDVLSGRVTPDAAIAHSASLGWNLDRPLVVMVAEIDPGQVPGGGIPPRIASERFAAAWQSVVRPFDSHAAVVGFNQEVIAVLGRPATDLDRYIRSLVREVAGDGGGGRRTFSTGVSRVLDGPQHLPAAYEQARTALRVSRQLRHGGGIAHFDSLGIFRLLSLIGDPNELLSFLHETLGQLADLEDVRAAELRQTLVELLDRGLNIAETSRAMHLHYNSLRYRVAKLEQILGPFLTDADRRLNIAVALRILDMRGL
jgi:PucR family transcriptional regulator, purine catabolism regulatory protein